MPQAGPIYARQVTGTNRSTFKAGVLALPDERLRLAMEDPDREALFLRALDVGLKNCDRTAVRTYAEARKIVGTQVDLSLTIINTVGAPPDEARAAVDMLRRVKDASPEEAARAALEEIDQYCRERGLTLEQARKSLAVHGGKA